MREYNIKDIDLEWIVMNYGFLIRPNTKRTSSEFADMIKVNYSLKNEHNKLAYKQLKQTDFIFERDYFGAIKVRGES